MTPPSLSDRTRWEHPFQWPDPPLSIVLVEPEIPPNTGNIARCCAATGSPLHLVEPLGFRLTDTAMKRAGLDYWSHVDVQRHLNWEAFIQKIQPPRLHLFSTSGKRSFFDTTFREGDYLVFGSETKGLPDALLQEWPDHVIGLPMRLDRVRSLNLANAVGIALYEALRQIQSGPTHG